MTAVPAPRIGWGIAASVALHAAVIAALLFAHTSAPIAPPVYRVQMIAAPAGERAIGAVQSTPQPQPAEPPKAKPAPSPKPVVPQTKVPALKSKPVPKQTTPAPPTKAADQPKTAPAPAAGGGPTGGKGADVANVDVHGLDFPYPWYTDNIVRQLIKYFGTSPGAWVTTIRFVIHRDGTVDPSSIDFVTRSGNYSFDQRAYGAVESAARAKAFGPLPPGFNEDILPVTFRFSPSLNK